MKSFQHTFSSRLLQASKVLLTKPVRNILLRVPFLPASAARALDDIRFVEPDVLRFVGNTVRSGWCCMDVGAHCGTVSVRLARLVSPAGLVIAVEPIRGNADLLEHNLRARGLLTRCVIVRAAIGAEEGNSTMVRGEHSTTWHAAPRTDPEQVVEDVAVLPLDHLAEVHRAPDFVKVDIEGAEVDLLAGAARLRDIHRPIWLFEMHSAASWSLVPEFHRANYRAFDLQGKEQAGSSRESAGYGHVVFCPAEKIKLLD